MYSEPGSDHKSGGIEVEHRSELLPRACWRVEEWTSRAGWASSQEMALPSPSGAPAAW